ncbi:MAG: hypothetical protein U0183_14380 [Polyangiaceae bacterium]
MMRRLGIVIGLGGALVAYGIAHAAPRTRITIPQGKAGEMVVLDGGERVSKAQLQKELNDLQEALESDGVSLVKADQKPQRGKLYFDASTAGDAARDKAAFARKVTNLKALEASGFRGLLVKKGARGARVTTEGTLVPLSPIDAPRGPAPDDDPLQVDYEETMGTKKRAAVYVTAGMRDTGDPRSVGCAASLEGGIYLFDQKRPLAKVAASGKVTDGRPSGTVEIYLAGKAVDGYPKSGASQGRLSKAMSPPSAGLSYGWGPLSIGIEGSVAGELQVDTSNTPEGPSAAPTGPKAAAMAANGLGGKPHAGRCALSVTPRVRATGAVTAKVSAVAYRAKVKGTIVFLDLELPMSSRVAAFPPNLVEDFDAKLRAELLSGEVTLQIDTRIPQSLTDGLDWDKVYSKTLFDWDGLTANQTLASFRGKTTKL